MLFRNRRDAGRLLAGKLQQYADRPDVIVLALPRGGVPVGFEVAEALHAPLDVFLVRKLGVPGHEELAMGALATGGVRLLNRDIIEAFRISREQVEAVTQAEQQELERRNALYRDDRPAPDLENRTVILVDDGLATGSTMLAAAAAVRAQKPAHIIVAVPVGSPDTCAHLQHEVDDAVCFRTPEPFYSVGLWYEDFTQTSDEEVQKLLSRSESVVLPRQV
jgi:putative phosphoribosyl transferase